MRPLLLLLAAVSLTGQAATPTLPADIDPQSYSRLPFLPRSSLDAEGKRIFDAINTAVTGKQEELPRMGPPAASMYSIAVAEPFDRMNQLLRKTVVGPAYFEISTLVAAREYDQKYEWGGHEPAAVRAGVGAATIDVIRYNRSTAGLPEKDRVVIEFGRQLLKQHKLDSATYAKVVELFGKQGMIELSMSLGDYVMTAILLNTVDQRLPPGREANLPPQ
jgi:4-carboxymuconolactone decarboxylase